MENSIFCPECGYENPENADYCENCGKRFKERKFLFPLLILLLLLAYPLITNVGFFIPVQETAIANQPSYIERQVTTTFPVERDICENRSYRYSVLGGNVDSSGQFVKPYLTVINLEDMWGYFKVNFSYVNEKDFPYDIYGGKNLNENLDSGLISYEDAEFYSPTYEFYLGPEERVLINEPSEKPNKDATYWGIADIIEPKTYECRKVIEYINKTENKTFTEYKKVEKTFTINRYKTLNQIIGISSFFEWVIIVMLFFLIIQLIRKIKHEIK